MSEETKAPSLSRDEARDLAIVLDQIIPPSTDGRLPGAGEAGLVDYIEQVLQGSPLTRPVVVEGLAAIREFASQRGPDGLAGLSQQDRLAVLNAVASKQPALLPSLIFHTYAGYYMTGRVLEALGLEARPPHPKGYEMEPDDLSLLQQVRLRPKMYRE